MQSSSKITETAYSDFLSFAHRLANMSGNAILPLFRRAPHVDNKSQRGRFDPVTTADRAAEKAIRAAIAEAWPDHGIRGEEFGTEAPDAEFCWLIDPIDGTRSFIMGLPTWGTLIGLLHEGEPLLGIMNQPFTGERYWSDRRQSQMRGPDGECALATRSCATLDDALLACTSPGMFTRGYEQDRFGALSAAVRLGRFGTDCYAYCQLAAGHIDLVVEADLQAYDIAPLIPIVERAGGRVTTWEGESATEGGRIVASGDPRLHDAALKVLSG